MKHLLSILILLGLMSAVSAGQNEEVLKLAPEFDKRIYDTEIKFENTVILYGYWPSQFDGKNVAEGWCVEFDSKIKYIHLANKAGKIVGSTGCN